MAQTIHAGAPVAIGNGTGRVVVAADAAGQPTSVSVVLSGDSLEGLPTGHDHQRLHEYVLPMPDSGPQTGYTHVGLDWMPQGHMPDGIYSVAHFDVHFYLVDEAERDGLTFAEAHRAHAHAAPAPELVPAGFVIPPDGAVERMGLHGLDPSGPEFRGEPFRHAFIYGYYGGRQVFLEPMVSLDFLRERGDVTLPVPQPAAFTEAGYYPTRYRIGYEPARDEYRISLAGLRQQPGVTAAR
ncbi:DUF5602 domain-containing protein [Spiribacter halobius]|uniref:DUF5602 domain-containing protein n=1 Tax=Sediminicurvatus halobius TaxID=2182432 RepID=UPI0011B25036|nr:DUF5602 domain-containing protein [Spiribacter halobius]UEX76747.1 DUF5602 domain-containing protein [Spiribacter halobius]